MALDAHMPTRRWEWLDEADDVAPITSRSPSFVRLKQAEDTTPDLDGRALVTESPSMPAPAPSAPRDERGAHHAEDDGELRVRCEERALDLDVRTLQLSESIGAIDDAHVALATRGLLDDIDAMEIALRSTHLEGSRVIVQHVYEWLVNVVAQVDARLAAATRGEEPLESIGLTIAEYSSLFVRAILMPLLDEAIAKAERDDGEHAALEQLRERVVWTNWTVRRIAPASR